MSRIITVVAMAALIACSDRSQTASSATTTPTDSAAVVGNREGTARPMGSVVFLGTSLTAGYGVGADAAFPSIIQQYIDSAGLPFRTTNAGISGETSAGGLRRIDWVLQNPVDVLVLELGANDGLRGLDIDSLKQNLDSILARTVHRYPDAAIVIAGMEAPPNLGRSYTTRFHHVFTDLADKYHAALVPFLLQDVAGDRTLNQEDGIHPNPEGHRIVARNVWATLGPVLEKRSATGRDTVP